MVIKFYKIIDSSPVILLTLESWNNEEKYISAIPQVPVYPNIETETFMDHFYAQPLPWAYESEVKVRRKPAEGITIEAEVKMPDFDWRVSHRLAARIEGFIKNELSVIEHGY